MKKHFKYLKYVLRHKWHVALACFRRGLILRGILHDLSKFLPSEWFPYAEFFYGEGQHTPEDAALVDARFDRAWLLHQHRNPHHWQYWVLRNDSGTTVPIPMPHDCILEMLADWEGAGIAITGRREYVQWYHKNKGAMVLHPQTRAMVEHLLEND